MHTQTKSEMDHGVKCKQANIVERRRSNYLYEQQPRPIKDYVGVRLKYIEITTTTLVCYS